MLTERAERREGYVSLLVCWCISDLHTQMHSFLGCIYTPGSIPRAPQNILRQSDVVIKMHEAELNLVCPFPAPTPYLLPAPSKPPGVRVGSRLNFPSCISPT